MNPINLQKVDQIIPNENAPETARSRIDNDQLNSLINLLSSIDLNLPEGKTVSDIRAFNIRVAPNNNGGMINVVFKV